MKTMHCCVAINWFREKYPDGGELLGALTCDGKPMFGQEVLDYLDELEAKGYDYIPGCDNVDKTGHCAGHAS